jgi:hypothetical protein
MTDVAQVSNTPPAAVPQAPAAKDPAHLWKDSSFGFHDLLDIINPLQHIPIVATIYRYLTGDTIGNVARVAGDTLYGGPIGMAAGVVSAGVEMETGKDIGEHVMAMLTGDEPSASPPPVMTAAKTATEPSAVVPAAAAKPTGGLPLVRPATETDDPRQAFMARSQAMRLQRSGGDSANRPGLALSNHVVPLEARGLPLAGRPAIGTPFTAAPAGTPARGIVQAAASDAPPSAIRASLAPPDGTAPAAPALPSNPPIDISQQMLEALDKYARMQQRRPEQNRGAQVDAVH